MKTKKRGNSALFITPVGFGAWAIGGSGWEFGRDAQDDKGFPAGPSKGGAKGNSSVAPQNPTDAQWLRNERVTILEYEKVKIT